jgi:hypothetical protein
MTYAGKPTQAGKRLMLLAFAIAFLTAAVLPLQAKPINIRRY